MTRRELAALAVCLLCALAAALLGACTTTPPAYLPAELPHYPCKRQEGGKVVYYACSDMEWVEQQITRKESK